MTPAEARIQTTFAAYREAVEGWVSRKPAPVVRTQVKRLQDKAENGNAAAALELAIIEGVGP